MDVIPTRLALRLDPALLFDLDVPDEVPARAGVSSIAVGPEVLTERSKMYRKPSADPAANTVGLTGLNRTDVMAEKDTDTPCVPGGGVGSHCLNGTLSRICDSFMEPSAPPERNILRWKGEQSMQFTAPTCGSYPNVSPGFFQGCEDFVKRRQGLE